MFCPFFRICFYEAYPHVTQEAPHNGEKESLGITTIVQTHCPHCLQNG